MNCEEMREFIATEADDCMNRQDVKRHLDQCPACREWNEEQLKFEEFLSTTVKRSLAQVAPPDNLWASIRAEMVMDLEMEARDEQPMIMKEFLDVWLPKVEYAAISGLIAFLLLIGTLEQSRENIRKMMPGVAEAGGGVPSWKQ